MHQANEREDVPIRVQLSRESRSSADALRGLYLNAPDGAMVPLGELTKVQKEQLTRALPEESARSGLCTRPMLQEPKRVQCTHWHAGKKDRCTETPEGYGLSNSQPFASRRQEARSEVGW